MFETHLDFEAPLAELQNKIAELEAFSASRKIDVSDEIGALQIKLKNMLTRLV